MSKLELKTRLQSFMWHGGAMLVVFYLDSFYSKHTSYDLPQNVVLLIGLIIPQITKWLRNKYML